MGSSRDRFVNPIIFWLLSIFFILMPFITNSSLSPIVIILFIYSLTYFLGLPITIILEISKNENIVIKKDQKDWVTKFTVIWLFLLMINVGLIGIILQEENNLFMLSFIGGILGTILLSLCWIMDIRETNKKANQPKDSIIIDTRPASTKFGTLKVSRKGVKIRCPHCHRKEWTDVNNAFSYYRPCIHCGYSRFEMIPHH